MASIGSDEAALSSKARTPTQRATGRSRSDTMIPYLPRVEVKDSDNIPDLCPVPRLLSPFPDFSPGKAAAIEILNERFRLSAPTPQIRGSSSLPGHPFITDASTLLTATLQNPDRILEAIQNLVNERDAHKADLGRTNNKLQSVTDDLANTRIDHKAARHRYEELFRVASAKQVILWKHIESLHSQMAAMKGQPDPNLGAGYGLGSYMSVRGGSGMGVAMEKWVSEGMDGDRESRTEEEDSEKGTEHSFWSADDRVGNRNLDPHAQTFVPQIGSPQKFRRQSSNEYFKAGSPTRTSNHKMSSTPSTHNSYAVQDSFNGQPQHHYGSQQMSFTVTPQQSILPPHSLLAPLPPRWYGICPHSLAEETPCPLGTNCQFVPLCPLYNHKSGHGCPNFENRGSAACPFVHEYRSCEDVIANKPGGCDWEHNTADYAPRPKKNKAVHMKVRAHRSHMGKEEWDARTVLLSMREAHARGIFNGQQVSRGRMMY